MSTPLEEYALLGDRRTAALVSRAGSIDWWCVPRFDSGACFAALLGTSEHGRFAVAPADAATTTRRYRAGSVVLETEHTTASGVVRVTDCLAMNTVTPTLVRLVEGVAGTVDMEAELVMRFDYGAVVPWVRRRPDGLIAIAGPDGLRLRTPVDVSGQDFRTTARFTMATGDRVPFVLEWFPSHAAPSAAEDASALIRETHSSWQAWSAQCGYQGPYRDAVMRSLITLVCLTYEPTGAIVAAPTTSLPESIGGTRNWDYRFCWLRDATLTLRALDAGGVSAEGQRFLRWVLRAVAGDPDRMQIMYGLGGERRLTEHVLEWLPGWEGSAPVRVGNAAYDQLQLDVYGELVDALWQSARAGFPIDEDAWALHLALMSSLEKCWREPDAGIWEVRGPRRHFVHSKVLAWLAFDRAIALVEHRDDDRIDGPVDRWRTARDEIHAEVCERGYSEALGSFTQAYDDERLDAAALMIPLVGFLPADDPRVLSTIDAISEHLTVDGLVQRYVPDTDAMDGIGEPEGAFLPCSFWLVAALAGAGRHDAAHALFERLLGLANDLGLLAEEYDTRAGRLVGNFPQAFTHLALIEAATELDATGAGRRRRDRPDGEQVHVRPGAGFVPERSS